LYTTLPTNGSKPARSIDITTKGTLRVPLQPGEDGTVAVLQSDGFYFPFIYSVPFLWAKSPQALLVPRAVAQADGLTIIP
jgi:hypothetical protein